jgi:hypothetical protein
VEEALLEAVEIYYKQTKTRIVSVEHLIAIMVQTYRPKDRERILLIRDETQIDALYLDTILKRHELLNKWRDFKRRYDEE